MRSPGAIYWGSSLNEGVTLANLTLTNRNPHSQNHHVTIDLRTGTCTFADKRAFAVGELINNPDFIHPLINEPVTQPSDYLFHYEYNDIDELLYSGIYVYSRLIRTDKPLACHFKINPSSRFLDSKHAERIDFSFNRNQKAQDSILISQLEAINTLMLGFNFVFSENIIIDSQLTIEDLPDSIDGDSLYNTKDQLVALLKNPADFSRYELRYISPIVGFGVFAKEPVKTGDIISFYTGVKKAHDPSILNYAFIQTKDCLAMMIDASQYGNITRFINHAPDENTTINNSHNTSFMEANVKAVSAYLNGIEVILYKAQKDIFCGEQLLVDYGKRYFQKSPLTLFKTNGQLITQNKKNLKNYRRRKLNHIKIMATYGIKKAQIYLLIRLLIISFLLIGIFQAGRLLMAYLT